MGYVTYDSLFDEGYDNYDVIYSQMDRAEEITGYDEFSSQRNEAEKYAASDLRRTRSGRKSYWDEVWEGKFDN